MISHFFLIMFPIIFLIMFPIISHYYSILSHYFPYYFSMISHEIWMIYRKRSPKYRITMISQ